MNHSQANPTNRSRNSSAYQRLWMSTPPPNRYNLGHLRHNSFKSKAGASKGTVPGKSESLLSAMAAKSWIGL